MSELTQTQWAVVSWRGCEASGLTHQEALDLLRRLMQEKVHGLCIVTAAAASRMTAASHESITAGSARHKP